MTQYMLAVHGNADAAPPPEEEMQAMFAAVNLFNEEILADGTWVFGGGLEPPTTATVVDGTGTEALITDGPFIEGKEHLGGFWILELPDLDAALAKAKAASKACHSPVEVRPFQPT